MTTLPIEQPVIPLRQRMLDDMAMRRMGSRTQHDYVRHVRVFAAFLGRSPDTATAEDVRASSFTSASTVPASPSSTARCRRCASCSA